MALLLSYWDLCYNQHRFSQKRPATKPTAMDAAIIAIRKIGVVVINIMVQIGQKVKRGQPLNFPFKFASPNPKFEDRESEV